MSPELSKLLASHTFHYFIVPALALLSGLAGLFIDPKKNSKAAFLVIGVLASAAISATILGYNDDQNNDMDKQAQVKTIREQKEKIDSEADMLKDMSAKMDSVLLLAQQKGALAAVKPSEVDRPRVQQALAASVALGQQATSAVPGGTEIQYFSKDIDKAVVLKALHDAGFRFAEKEPQLPNSRTNAIWVGDPVPLSDAKVVALTLIRAGVQIHAIMRFREDSKHRDQHLIEIGAYPSVENDPVWTVERVDALSENGLPPREPKDSGGRL